MVTLSSGCWFYHNGSLLWVYGNDIHIKTILNGIEMTRNPGIRSLTSTDLDEGNLKTCYTALIRKAKNKTLQLLIMLFSGKII